MPCLAVHHYIYSILNKQSKMKNLIAACCLLLTLSQTMIAFAETPKKQNQAWKKNFAGGIKWYKVTDAGIVIVCTADALYGMDPLTGTERWKNTDLRNVQEDNYDPIDASPLIAIVDRGLTPPHIVLDVYTGKVLVNTKEAGLSQVQKRFADPDLQGIFFFGIGKTGKPIMMLIDANTGAKRWEVEKIFEKNTEQIVSAPYSLNKESFVIATTKGIYKVNTNTGEILWNSDMKNDAVTVQVAETKNPFGAFKAMNKAAGANATATNATFFVLDKYPNTIYFYSQDNFTAFNIADGKEIWERVKLKSPVTDIIYDSHGLLVATAENGENEKKGKGLMGKLVKAATDGNKARLMCMDYATGKELWKDYLSIAGDVVYYKYADLNTLALATANEKGKNRIDIVNLADGTTKTKNPFKVSGDILDIRLLQQGLLYRTTDELNILDLNSAKDAWSKSIKFKNGNMGVDKGDDTFIFGDGKLYRFNNVKGDYDIIASDIDFDGGEAPGSAELMDNGLLFSSDQNMLLTDFEGKKVYSVYKKAPGKSLAGKILLGTLAVAGTSMNAAHSYNAGYASASGQSSAAEYHEKQASNWGGIAGASFQEFSKRFKATATSRNYRSILTKTADSDDSGVGIVLINKATGKEDGSVVLNDKKPDYKLDDISRMVFYKSGNDEITAFAF